MSAWRHPDRARARVRKARGRNRDAAHWFPRAPAHSPGIPVDGGRIGRVLGAARFDLDELGLKLIGEARDNLVLHVEQVGDRLVEALRPQVRAALGVDELDVDAHALAAALNAAFERIAHVELAADLLRVDRLALVGESGAAADHEGPAHARKIGGQALRHPVDEIVLLGPAADVGERQHDDRERRRPVVFPTTPGAAPSDPSHRRGRAARCSSGFFSPKSANSASTRPSIWR